MLPPTNLKVVDAGGGQVTAKWDAPNDPNYSDSYYQIWGLNDQQVFSVDTTWDTTDTFEPSPGVTQYVVLANGFGPYSNYAPAPGESAPAPAAPQNLSATPFSNATGSGVRLLWDNTSDNEDGFVIQRSADGGNTWSQIGQVGPDIVTYVDSSEPPNIACLYRVGSYIGAGNPSFSNTASEPVPAAPSDLTATRDNTHGTVNLYWNNRATSADGIEVQWSADGQNFVTIDNIPGASTSYTDMSPLSGPNDNHYRVVAYRNVPTMLTGVEESAPSNSASDKPIDPPVAVDDDNGGANLQDTVAPYVTQPGATLTVSGGDGVLANDFDPQGMALSIASHTNPRHGTLTLDSGGGFTYVPDPGFAGNDGFTYTNTNGYFSSDAANVAITVSSRPVQTKGDYYTLPSGGALTIAAGALAANDINPDNSTITYRIDPGGGAQHGSLVLNTDGSFTYTPDSSFAGIDQFRYYVTDGFTNSNVSPVVIASGGALSVPPNFSSTGTPDPSTFPNNLRGLWDSYLASKSKLTDVLHSMADVGATIRGLASGTTPTDAQLDSAVAGLEGVYGKFDAYVVQATSTLHAAATDMRSVYITTQAKADVLNAINALPLSIAGMVPNRTELQQFQAAMADFGDGANITAGNNGKIVQIAESTHDAAEKAIQIGGAITVVGGAADILAETGCEAFAGYVAKQIVSTSIALAAGAVAQNALALAQRLGIPGVDADNLRIFADGVQLLFLVKAAREANLAANSNCFVAGTEVVTRYDATSGVFSQTAIQDIQVGQEVLTRNQYDPGGPVEEQKVLATYQHTVYTLEDVAIQDARGKLETIQCTGEHPFYVEGVGWTRSRQLVPGEKLSEPDGTEATIVAATSETCPKGVIVYNFTANQDHTYFVDAGAGGVWVHNSCYTGSLRKVNVADPAADELAAHLGGESSVKFDSDPAGREFDAISDRTIGEAKPAGQTLGSDFRRQAKAVFDAASKTSRNVFYWFKDTPGPGVVQTLEEYAARYGVKLEIKIGPLS